MLRRFTLNIKISTFTVPIGALVGLAMALAINSSNVGLLAGVLIGGLIGGFIGLYFAKRRLNK